MKLTKGEKELIEMIRKGLPGGVIIQRLAACGNFVVFVGPHPHDAAVSLGKGATFDDAWAARGTLGKLTAPN